MGSQNGDNTEVKQTWIEVPLENDSSIRVSNKNVTLPVGLDVVHDFMTREESDQVLKEISSSDMVWEGFEQRRRVQRFGISDEELPSSLSMLAERVVERTGNSPNKISIEEYPRNQLAKVFNPSLRSQVLTFESPIVCQCRKDECACFVAVVPLFSSVIEHVNRPKRRHADCWDLYSPDHWTGLALKQRSLLVKKNEFLWQWRSRISAAIPSDEDRIVLVKFFCLPETSPVGGTTPDSMFERTHASEETLHTTEEMPPLEEMLTIIVTTSPVKSNPSTELHQRVFDTFKYGGIDFAYKCRKVIVCDGCRIRDETVSKKHNNAKQAMRNGIVTASQWDNYIQFKSNLRALCESAGEDSPFFNSVVEELEYRQGYGFALRHALRECISTPYVIVIQHDRTFMRPTPIHETVKAMWHHRNIKYVGMSMRSNLMYRDHFLGKYGRSYSDDMSACIIRPPELALDADMYGPNSQSTKNMDYAGRKKLKDNIRALMETYRASQQNIDNLEWVKANPPQLGKWQLSLTPTFFWYVKNQICEMRPRYNL